MDINKTFLTHKAFVYHYTDTKFYWQVILNRPSWTRYEKVPGTNKLITVNTMAYWKNYHWYITSIRNKVLEVFLKQFSSYPSINPISGTHSIWIRYKCFKLMDILMTCDLRAPFARNSFLKYSTELITFDELCDVLQPYIISHKLG